MSDKLYDKNEAIEYLAEHGRQMTMNGINYNLRAGRLPRRLVDGKVQFTEDELQTYLRLPKKGENPKGYGRQIITPAMFYNEGYAHRVQRQEVQVMLNDRQITDTYPSPEVDRAYVAVYEDGSAEILWSNRSLRVIDIN